MFQDMVMEAKNSPFIPNPFEKEEKARKKKKKRRKKKHPDDSGFLVLAQLRIISKWTLSVHQTVRYVKDYKYVIIIFGYVKESFIEHFVCEQALNGRGGGKNGTCV